MKNRVGLFCACCACICALGSVPGVYAQSYPARAVRVIVPFAPGGGTDFIARVMKLHGETLKAISDEALNRQLVDLGFDMPGGTPDSRKGDGLRRSTKAE